MLYKDKIVVITGGAHGIGKATKEAFEAEGAIVESENVGWTSAKKWFPGRYERCGVSALSLLGE